MSQESTTDRPDRGLRWRRLRELDRHALAAVAVIGVLGVEIGAFAIGNIINAPTKAKKVPVTLPRPVRAEQASAVKVSFSDSKSSSLWYSGEKISSNMVVTTGDAVLYKNPKGKIACSTSNVINRFSTPDHADQITAQRAVDNDQGFTAGEDLAVLRVRPTAAFAQLPVARLANSSPSKGSVVYFVNYEDGPNNQEFRVPNAAEAQAASFAYKGTFYGHAAEYAGIVVGKSGPYVVIATGEKDYNPLGRAESSYSDAEGGPIFSQAGQTFAIDTGSAFTEKASDVASNYGVTLPFPSQTSVQLELGQLTTKPLVDSLIESLPARNVC